MSRYKQSLTTLAVVLLLPFTSPTTQAAQLQSPLTILEQTSTAAELYLESAPAKASQPKAKNKRKTRTNTKSAQAKSKALAKNSKKHKKDKRSRSRRRGSGLGYSYEPVEIASHTPELIRSVMEHGHEQGARGGGSLSAGGSAQALVDHQLPPDGGVRSEQQRSSHR